MHTHETCHQLNFVIFALTDVPASAFTAATAHPRTGWCASSARKASAVYAAKQQIVLTSLDCASVALTTRNALIATLTFKRRAFNYY